MTEGAQDRGPDPGELELRAGEGDAAACMELATAYRDGLGVRADRKRARKLYMQAADAGEHIAWVLAGDMDMSDGRRSKAADLYLRASGAHVPEAESRLAAIYMSMEEYGYALDHAERGAVLGMKDCMLYLGRIYYHGLDTEPDHMHALYWYSRCCRDYPEAMRCVGIIRTEKDTPYFDMYKGLAALRLAADRRDEEARRRLLEFRLDAETDGLPDDYFDPPEIPQYTEPIIERMDSETVPRKRPSGLLSRILGKR